MKYIIVSIVLVVSTALFLANSINGAAIGDDNQDVVKYISVNVSESSGVNEDCHQPKFTGRCYALFQRYAFDVEKGVCEEFIYGGCGGNGNNFESKEACEKKCLTTKSKNPESEGSNSSTTSTTTEANSQTKDAEGK